MTMPAVAALSSVTHHVMVTAMMLPILTRFAKSRGLSASRLLMPMSWGGPRGAARRPCTARGRRRPRASSARRSAAGR
ncbi:hypothetical protein ACFV0Y_36245 [Streptomyces sp. NPDC059569]|uniref:hypothetical protein n=1 Tax=Streptomyces sp. NPDC059569 TaxID=3346869 RepID=UPI0036C24F2E